MRSIFVLLILVMIGLNGKGQSVTALPDSVLSQCCLEVTLLNGNVTTVDWVFIQYITRDGTGTKLFVEYAPNFGGIQWETQIRIQDDFDEVLARSKFIMLPFTVGSTDYAINRNWVANIEENTTTGGTWVYGRFGTPAKRKFSAVEDYETLKNLLLACRPRAIVVAENGLYTEGDTVRMGGFLIEPTTIETNTYPFTITDDDTGIRFGLSYTYAPSDTVFYFDRVWAGDLFRQHSWYFGRNKLTHIITNDTSTIQVVTNNRVSPSFNVTTFIGSSTGSSLIVSGNASVFGSSNYIDNVYTNVGTGLNSSSLNLISDSTITGLIMGLFRVPVTGKVFMALKTPRVDDTTAVNGQFLQLKDVISGEVDFATIDLSGYLEIADTTAMLAPYVTFGNLSGYPTGSGTTDRSARWSATNTLAAGNFTDNGTKVQALLPFQLQQWTTAGRPAGVTGYKGYNTTTGFEEGYFTSQWENIITSTGASANQIAVLASAGKIVGNNNFTWNGSQIYVANAGGQVADFRVNTTTPQGIRITQISSDGRTGLAFYDNGGQANILVSRPTYAGGVFGFGPTGLSANAGISAGMIWYGGRMASLSLFIGQGHVGDKNLVIAGAGQPTGAGAGYGQLGGSAGVFDIGTDRKISNVPSGVKDSLRFTASAFMFASDESPGGIAGTRVTMNRFFNTFTQSTNFGSGTPPAPITAIDARTTTRGTRPFPGVSILQRSALAGRVYKIKVISGGTGYGGTTPTDVALTISGGGGSGCTATGKAYNGVILQVVISTEGSGYTSPPTITVGGSGTGAVLTAEITSMVDGLSIYNTDTKTQQFWDLSEWRDFGSKQSDDIVVTDTIFNTNPATHSTIDGFATWKSTAQGYALGKATFGAGLSFSGGVLSATGSADGNGIYTGSGTISQHTTRALIPSTGNLFFSQKFNANADSAYFNIVNYLGGERAVNFGLTDTSSTGYARGYFESDGAGSMNWRLETNDVNGSTTVRALDGELDFITTAGNISITAPVDQEVRVVGMVRAKQEGYYEINSTSSPQNLSNDYSDNFINQGGTQASFTLVFPASPEDGQILKITYNNAISSLTLDGNGNTIVGTTVTTAVAGTQRVFKFYAGDSVWIRQN